MRAKELKNFLERVPEDTEILLRCQCHELSPAGAKETIGITSITPHINGVEHQIMLNADRPIRLCSLMPDANTLVSCLSCVRGSRIKVCKQRNKICEECDAVCDCKVCNNYNIDSRLPFSTRPKYEEDPHKHR